MRKTPNFIGFQTLLRKEFQRFMKVAGQTVVSPLINAALYLLIFGVNLTDQISNQNGVNYLQFIIPGLVSLGILNNSFLNSSSSIIISKFHGDLQDLKTVPLSPLAIVWAYAFASTLRGAVIGFAITLVGEVFYYMKYAEFLPIAHVLWLFVFILLGGLTFGFLGLSVAVFANNFDQVSAIGTFVILPLIYLGGVFFSIETMHPFWKNLSHANPLLYLINGIRYSFLNVSDIPVMTAFLFAVSFVFGSFFLALQSIKKGSYTRF